MQSNTVLHKNTPRVELINRNHIEDFRRTQEKYNSWAGLVVPDTTLMIAIGLLIITGLVMVTSASIPLASKNGGWVYHYSIRQFIYFVIGLCAAFIAYRIPTTFWYKHALRFLCVGIIMLILVQVPGISREINGAKRWIPLGPVNIQVSEFVRICVIIYAAAYLKRYQNQIHKSLFSMAKLMGVLATIGALLLAQPDFGSTVVFFAVVLGMMFLAGVCLMRFFVSLGVVGSVGVFVLLAESYRIKRLTGFLDPWADKFGDGYQLVNSLIAIGRGEIFGVGMGESLEKHHYLPEAHTDFIFSILSEETGLIGVCVLMTLFGLVVWRAFVIANNADKVRMRFASCIAYGVGLWVGMQALINMSVASGLLPTKGLTLPLISYGGSSVVASLILLAILLRIDSESRYLLQQEQMRQNSRVVV